MNNATRTLASALGVYAAVLGLEHGYFETIQGNIRPDGVIIEAFGPPCRAESVWHACQPAMTIMPNMRMAGITAMLTALIVLIGAIFFIHRKRGGLILIGLSIIMMLVGGGFIPPMIGIIAGAVGTRINTSLDWWRVRLSGGVGRSLAALWPWSLIVYFLWVLPQWIVGYYFNDLMMQLGLIITLVNNLLLLLSILAGLARDVQREKD